MSSASGISCISAVSGPEVDPVFDLTGPPAAAVMSVSSIHISFLQEGDVRVLLRNDRRQHPFFLSFNKVRA